MVVNHHEAQAQRLHPLLEERLSQNIALYKQHEHQPDVWSTLNGEKDDFFIYDRCGRLTHHLSLPYNIIGHGHVEQAIKEAYCHRVCGECSFEVHTTLSLMCILKKKPLMRVSVFPQSADTPAECQGKDNAQPETEGAQPAGEEHQHQHPHHGHRGHNHGDNHGLHPRGFGHGHDHRHGHHHRHHHGRAETRLQEHQHHTGSDRMQHAVQLEQIGQEVVGAPVRP
uniref:Selenoprotein P N-terminal domain-containing protein n=1 Tax=Oryzias sinensis TaxID=183150 RepID=A0A8C7ZNG8_9TELE